MSVTINKNPDSRTNGRLVVSSQFEYVDPDEYVARINSLIRVLQNQDEEMMSREDISNVLNILNDMMPTREQAAKMFESA